MVSSNSQTKYRPSIGIECHVQLKTKTKLFAAVDNDARDAEPNTLISHICLGMPGALPVLNEKAVELATRMAFALNTKPQTYNFFSLEGNNMCRTIIARLHNSYSSSHWIRKVRLKYY